MPAKSLEIVVVGPGAMGCLFAGLLKESGRDVSILDHNAARAKAISRDGITLVEDGKERRVKVSAVAGASRLGRAGIVMVCVKAYDTAAAAGRAADCVGDGTVVVSLQNGAGNIEAIRGVLGGAKLVCGATGWGATLSGVGTSRISGKGPTLLAAVDKASCDAAAQVRCVLEGAGFKATVSGNPESVIWGKLVLNSAINPLTALLEVQNGALLEIPEARETMLKVAAETAAVATAAGVKLPYKDAGKEAVATCIATRTNVSSMLQDVRRRRKTEIDQINGFVVAKGAELGVATPINSMLLRKVRDLETRSNGNDPSGAASRPRVRRATP